MKTILHTIDTTGPGGAETVFIDLATHLPKESYRSIVLIRDKGWVYEELSRRGITPLLMDTKGSFNWRYLWGLISLIRREKLDCIQSHLLGTNVYCSLAGLLTHTPVVATFHGAVDIGEKERFKGIKFGIINRGSSFIVAVSNSLRDSIVYSTPLKSGKTRVIYNGTKTDDYQRPHSNDLRHRFGWTSEHRIIGSLGNIRSAKGYDILLRAAALLRNKSDSYRFVIAGQAKNGLYDELLQLRKELDLEDHIQFLGFNDDPAGFLSNLDLFLLSSTSEGFSIATIQAMAAGLTVIATRSGGPEEIITHGENGWLVQAGSPEAIAEGIEKLASKPDLCAGLGDRGRTHARDTFGIEVMLNEYQEIYNSLD